jgi:hypothetical protein
MIWNGTTVRRLPDRQIKTVVECANSETPLGITVAPMVECLFSRHTSQIP